MTTLSLLGEPSLAASVADDVTANERIDETLAHYKKKTAEIRGPGELKFQEESEAGEPEN